MLPRPDSTALPRERLQEPAGTETARKGVCTPSQWASAGLEVAAPGPLQPSAAPGTPRSGSEGQGRGRLLTGGEKSPLQL